LDPRGGGLAGRPDLHLPAGEARSCFDLFYLYVVRMICMCEIRKRIKHKPRSWFITGVSIVWIPVKAGSQGGRIFIYLQVKHVDIPGCVAEPPVPHIVSMQEIRTEYNLTGTRF
jgi:hypothetical protein